MYVSHPTTFYSYSITACTSEGCITSSHANITTLEAPPARVEAPTVNSITANSVNVSWSKPLTQNGEVTEYVLKLNQNESYSGTELHTVLSDLQPHTTYQLVLSACTSGGCTISTTVSTTTEEAPPTGLPTPNLKVFITAYWFVCLYVSFNFTGNLQVRRGSHVVERCGMTLKSKIITFWVIIHENQKLQNSL